MEENKDAEIATLKQIINDLADALEEADDLLGYEGIGKGAEKVSYLLSRVEEYRKGKEK